MQADERSGAAHAAAALERYLHEEIPLSVAMGVRVRSATRQRVELEAPLGPNINHHETVFGGSAIAIATLAAWGLLHLRLDRERSLSRLVIQRSSMQYLKPIPGDFTAVCEFDDTTAWSRFVKTLERHGRARLGLQACIVQAARQSALFDGDFVALRGP